MEPVCNYAYLAGEDDVTPCWGSVSLVESTDMANGDRIAVHACTGHRSLVERGFYLVEGVMDTPGETDQ